MNLEFKNLYYITIIVIGLLISLFGFVSYELLSNFENENFIYYGLSISETSGLFMLLFNGTFIKTRYFKIIRAAISIIIIGVLAKIMHWEFSDFYFIVGFLSIIIIYFLSFLKKPIKKRLDYLKLFWVIIAYSAGILSFLHLITKDYQILTSAIMWLAIIDYLKAEKEKGKLLD